MSESWVQKLAYTFMIYDVFISIHEYKNSVRKDNLFAQ